MATINLGKVGLTLRGAYDSTTTYEKLDIVSSDGNSYVAKKGIPAGVTTSNDQYWDLLVEKGEPGYGAIWGEIGGTLSNQSDLQNILNEKLNTSAIDDTAGEGDDDVVWSADKTYNEVNKVATATSPLTLSQAYATIILPDTVDINTLYYTNQGKKSVSSFSVTKKYTVSNSVRQYYVTSKMRKNLTNCPIVIYFDSTDQIIGNEYQPDNTDDIIVTEVKLNVPKEAAYFYINYINLSSDSSDMNECVIKGILDDKVLTIQKHIISNIDTKSLYNNLEPVSPDEITTGKNYSVVLEKFVESSTMEVKKYLVDYDFNTYYVTTSLSNVNGGIPAVVYFDESNHVIGYEYNTTSGHQSVSLTDALLHIPVGTKYMYVNARNAESSLKKSKKSLKDLSIFFIGNSLTQDAVAYLPYLLKYYAPEISFRIYDWHNSGHGMRENYQKWINNVPADRFSVAENSISWTQYEDTKTMYEILQSYTFDTVCLQPYLNYRTYSQNTVDDWNNCKDYIQNYSGGNGLKFISLFHAPLRSDLDTVFERVVNGNKLLNKETNLEAFLVPGVALYRALQYDELKDLGDEGGMSPDGTHAQEGLPCLLQTYTIMLWVFEQFRINKSIYNDQFRITTSIYESINVPGPHLGTGLITGTDAQNLLAQEIAIRAYKEGKKYYNDSLFE